MKTFVFSILAFLCAATSALAQTEARTEEVQFKLNHGDIGAFGRDQVGTELIKHREHSLKCVYDFSVSGGSSAANINLLDEVGKACVLPKNAIIRDVLIDVVTAPTSGGLATISLGSGVSAVDFKAATAIATYSGLVAGIPIGSAATAIKLTGDKTPVAKIAVAPLTAGKLNIHIKYQLSQ